MPWHIILPFLVLGIAMGAWNGLRAQRRQAAADKSKTP